MSIAKEKKIHMLKQMMLIRRFEEKVKLLYNQGLIAGAIHLYIGQEAVAVGVCQALKGRDYVFSTHRGHGHAIAKGCDLKRMMAELMGRKTGLCGGHGGSMHLFDRSKGLMGGNGIVGGGIPLSLGAAFTSQYRDTEQVSVVFFSDGAANQGTFSESLNLAALFQLPVVLVCENNCYAATTPVTLSTARLDFPARALSYGVQSDCVNGNDVLEVFKASEHAIAHARSGKGPFFIECKTYRIEPHCGIIPDQREKGEREVWRKKDPVLSFGNLLINTGVITRKTVDEIEKEIERRLEEATDYAIKSPWPDINARKNTHCMKY
jgi:TPP-dependent pyruvate/acetoin dehydrogenase alpha subunit